MCCFHMGDWALPERGGGRKGLPEWFGALFSHVCPGGKRACHDVLEHFFSPKHRTNTVQKGASLTCMRSPSVWYHSKSLENVLNSFFCKYEQCCELHIHFFLQKLQPINFMPVSRFHLRNLESFIKLVLNWYLHTTMSHHAGQQTKKYQLMSNERKTEYLMKTTIISAQLGWVMQWV